MPSKKLEIIYYNGQPDGIRSIRKHLSTTPMSFHAPYLLKQRKYPARKGPEFITLSMKAAIIKSLKFILGGLATV